jgi:hypothetical protein
VTKKKPKRSAADEAAKATRLADPGYSEFLKRAEGIAAKHRAGTDVGSFTDMTSLSTPAKNFRLSKPPGGRYDALGRRLKEIVARHPSCSWKDVIDWLRKEEGAGLIVEVDDENNVVRWTTGKKGRAERRTEFKSIENRLTNVRKKLGMAKARKDPG